MHALEQQWTKIQQTIKEEMEMTDIAYDTWIGPLQFDYIDGNTAYLFIPNVRELNCTYIVNKYGPIIQTAISSFFNDGIDYVVSINNKSQSKLNTKDPNIKVEGSNLNPNYTFDTFVVGNNNKFAHAASLAVAESPGQVYNPLFLYGGVGLGKTHLMHSIAHYIRETNSSLKVLYVTSETFTNELIDAIGTKSTKKFRTKYRNIDVLLVDDVQFIIGKESTQEEFFNTFNELHTINKQIILSSDRPPKEMETLEERIRSRFEWGVLADIGTPDYETRMAILKQRKENDNVDMNDEILEYIAKNVVSNIRELEGALNRLVAYSRLSNIKITMDLAEDLLKNIISPEKSTEITAQTIIETVCDHYGLTIDTMISKKRTNNINKPRQIAMYLCRDLTDSSLQYIGNLLGNRDHTTVLNGVNKVEEAVDKDDQLRINIEAIRKKIVSN